MLASVLVSNDGIVTFPQLPSNPPFIARADNTKITKDTIEKYKLTTEPGVVNTALSGLANAINFQYNMRETLVMDPALAPWPLPMPGPSWITFQHIMNYKDWDHGADWAPKWKDPREDMMASLNELMFRRGVYAAQNYNETYLKPKLDDGLEIYNRSITGYQTSPELVYSSDFSYCAGAAIVQLLTIFTILFTFYGFWRLGRRTSFSPLEIAKVCINYRYRFTIPNRADKASKW